jgi:hypothetical protein
MLGSPAPFTSHSLGGFPVFEFSQTISFAPGQASARALSPDSARAPERNRVSANAAVQILEKAEIFGSLFVAI